jgi:hypothetical protein
MARPLDPGARLVLASHNPGKLVEIRELLAPWDIHVVSAGELGLPEPEETETSFAGNARLKAQASARRRWAARRASIRRAGRDLGRISASPWSV